MKKVKILILLCLFTANSLWAASSQQNTNPITTVFDCTSQRIYVHQLIIARRTVSGNEIIQYFYVRTQANKLIYLMEVDEKGRDIQRYDSGETMVSGLSFGFEMSFVQDFVFGSDGRYKLEQVMRPVATFKWCTPWAVTIRS
jgi:hypothetical protein